MIYLILSVVIIFTMKLIIDKNLYNSNFREKVLSVPFGKYIDIIISKFLTGWRMSHNIWLYFIRGTTKRQIRSRRSGFSCLERMETRMSTFLGVDSKEAR